MNVHLKKKETMSVSLTLYSEWIRDLNLNVRPENLKALNGNMCELLQDASLGKSLLQRTPSAQEVIQEITDCSPGD